MRWTDLGGAIGSANRGISRIGRSGLEMNQHQQPSHQTTHPALGEAKQAQDNLHTYVHQMSPTNQLDINHLLHQHHRAALQSISMPKDRMKVRNPLETQI